MDQIIWDIMVSMSNGPNYMGHNGFYVKCQMDQIIWDIMVSMPNGPNYMGHNDFYVKWTKLYGT